MAGKGFAVGSGNVAYIGVGARITTSTETVKNMDIHRRNCVRHDETDDSLDDAAIDMDIFEHYSRRSCLLECRAHLLRKECQCLPYYFPNFGSVWKENTACNITGLKCLARHASTRNGGNFVMLIGYKQNI